MLPNLTRSGLTTKVPNCEDDVLVLLRLAAYDFVARFISKSKRSKLGKSVQLLHIETHGRQRSHLHSQLQPIPWCLEIQNHVQSVQQISGFHRVVVLPAESCKRQVGDVQAKMLTNKRNRAHKRRDTVQANHDDAHLALSNEVPSKPRKSK